MYLFLIYGKGFYFKSNADSFPVRVPHLTRKTSGVRQSKSKSRPMGGKVLNMNVIKKITGDNGQSKVFYEITFLQQRHDNYRNVIQPIISNSVRGLQVETV